MNFYIVIIVAFFYYCYYYSAWRVIFSTRKKSEELGYVRVDNKYFSPLKQHSVISHLSSVLDGNIICFWTVINAPCHNHYLK